ncbi:cytochrome P450 11B, mitochondrial-like, partial [Chiloscyllium plagiosum]|uniref:cytochrome P450 11B, mitochondrial-like n=1 Tax=Chiloscyllium plagiosum TaxID=36176 RepID=UPI001CB7F4F6
MGGGPGDMLLHLERLFQALDASFHLLYGERLGLFAEEVDPSSERFIQAVEEMLQTTIPLLYIPLELAKWLNMKPWRDHVAAWDFLFEHADQCFRQLLLKLKNVPEGERQYLGIIPELIHQSKLPIDIIKANSVEMMVGSVETTHVHGHSGQFSIIISRKLNIFRFWEETHILKVCEKILMNVRLKLPIPRYSDPVSYVTDVRKERASEKPQNHK